MGNTGLRPDEASRLELRDVKILNDEPTGERILKFGHNGHIRTCYSLRHTYVRLRLLEGTDIYQVAKNCRTSVEMIEKFYGRHSTNTIRASAVNVRRAKPVPVAARKKAAKAIT